MLRDFGIGDIFGVENFNEGVEVHCDSCFGFVGVRGEEGREVGEGDFTKHGFLSGEGGAGLEALNFDGVSDLELDNWGGLWEGKEGGIEMRQRMVKAYLEEFFTMKKIKNKIKIKQ